MFMYSNEYINIHVLYKYRTEIVRSPFISWTSTDCAVRSRRFSQHGRGDERQHCPVLTISSSNSVSFSQSVFFKMALRRSEYLVRRCIGLTNRSDRRNRLHSFWVSAHCKKRQAIDTYSHIEHYAMEENINSICHRKCFLCEKVLFLVKYWIKITEYSSNKFFFSVALYEVIFHTLWLFAIFVWRLNARWYGNITPDVGGNLSRVAAPPTIRGDERNYGCIRTLTNILKSSLSLYWSLRYWMAVSWSKQ